MLEGILGKKVGMSRWFDSEGNSHGVTLIKCGPCYVSSKPGSGRIQIGFEEVKEKSLTKARVGHLKKNGLPALRHLKEVKWRGEESSSPSVGEVISAGIFEEGEKVDVQGISKGKGFAGVVKRWGFRGGRASHGSTTHRKSGSIGAGSDPSRVWPGQKMAGRMGGEKTTVFNLEVVKIDSEENLVALKGAVPGPNKSVVFLRRTLKAK